MSVPIATQTGDTRYARGGFSLIELLTVIAIITLLISILIPSLTAARNSAKKTSTLATLNGLKVALESFKNDNERDFVTTNGYPPSFVHPPIKDYAFQAHLGEFPFFEGKPKIYGAHWLPAMLMGVDLNGYVQRSSVPPTLADKPAEWYKPLAYNNERLPRAPLYLDPGGVRLVTTENLPGRRPTNDMDFFPNWGQQASPTNETTMRQLPVIVDAFDQPFLYYAANKFANGKRLVASAHSSTNTYKLGQPYYFHKDNEGFTGRLDGLGNNAGWNFAGGASAHPIANSGEDVDARNVATENGGKTFAYYILERNSYKAMLANNAQPSATAPLKAVNPDSYLLISAGVDGLFGTRDDVTNLPVYPN